MHLVIYYQKQIELKNTTLNLIRVKINDPICNFNCIFFYLRAIKRHFICMYMYEPHTDPESFARGGPALTDFLLFFL